ncbi:MAG: DUF4157 domain-containing protein [bacterium]|nr:DUF4157 domain-containing protein [bacterium]
MSDFQHAKRPSTAAKVSSAHKAHTQAAPDALTQLQRTIGNHAVTKMLGVQAKLTVGAADDAYEAEADQVAQQVMTMPAAPVQRADEDEMSAKRMDIVQRADEDEMSAKRMDIVQRADEDEMAAKRMDIVQRADDDEMAAKRDDVDMMDSFQVGDDLESQIENKSGGQPLDSGVREFMEPRFGQNFENVRVHADPQANQLSQSIQAKAFTKGSDVFFADGQYQPDTPSGKELLAHELTHVVQQTGGQ